MQRYNFIVVKLLKSVFFTTFASVKVKDDEARYNDKAHILCGRR